MTIVTIGPIHMGASWIVGDGICCLLMGRDMRDGAVLLACNCVVGDQQQRAACSSRCGGSDRCAWAALSKDCVCR
jgi:hypothetical protein